jgi:glycosyltransferase involved in cell wall biosynthesis
MGSAEEMASALERLLANPAQAQAMGQAGRRRVAGMFTIRHTARKMEAVYASLFARRRFRPVRPPSPTSSATGY